MKMDKKKETKKTQKIRPKKTTSQNQSKVEHKVDWFVLMGYKKDDKDKTGFLAIDQEKLGKNAYVCTKDKKKALKFPSENVYNVDSFGTPKQWLDFFKEENELSDWEFHLSKVRDPRKNI